MFTNISEILSSAIKLRLIFVANSAAASNTVRLNFVAFLVQLRSFTVTTWQSRPCRETSRQDKKEANQKVRKLLSTDLLNTNLVCESGTNCLK